MEFLTALWLPVVLAAVGVFIVSSVLHMALQYHKNDYVQLPNEAALLAALRAQGVKPGQYMFPRPASMKECQSPEMIAKFKQGPVGNMIVLPEGMPSMGKALLLWFLFSVLVGVFAAYVGWHGVARGAAATDVMRITGTVAFAGYGLANITDSIWKGSAWSTTMKFLFDALLYGLVTGAIFAWQWPAA